MLEFPSSSHETSVHDEVGNNKYVIELDSDEYGWTRYVSLDPQVHFFANTPFNVEMIYHLWQGFVFSSNQVEQVEHPLEQGWPEQDSSVDLQ